MPYCSIAPPSIQPAATLRVFESRAAQIQRRRSVCSQWNTRRGPSAGSLLHNHLASAPFTTISHSSSSTTMPPSAIQLAMLSSPPPQPHPECTSLRHAWIAEQFERREEWVECGQWRGGDTAWRVDGTFVTCSRASAFEFTVPAAFFLPACAHPCVSVRKSSVGQPRARKGEWNHWTRYARGRSESDSTHDRKR